MPVDFLLAGLPAFLACALCLVPVIRAAPRLGLVDVPSARSTHDAPVPRVGGIGVVCGIAAALAVLALRGHAALDAVGPWVPYLGPALLYFAIGLVDDRRGLPPAPKFLAQAAAAALAVGLGLRWEGAALVPFGALGFGALTPVMTWLWLVAVVTLVNFIDGIDLITSATVMVVLGAAAGAGAGPGGGLLYAISAAALLGMVTLNVTPARVFPGDGGTHLLGFLTATAACGVPSAAPSATGLPWVAASAPLLPGVIDIAAALVGKHRRGISLAAAHSQHIHQRLTKVGWSHAGSALRYGALALAALFMVTVVAGGAGLAVCIGISAGVLGTHLVTAWRATRHVSWPADDAGNPP